ncbi:MAG: cytochrome P450 [Thermosynechococcaceae cyanobacterium]
MARNVESIPHADFALPIIGNALNLFLSQEDFFLNCFDKYGPIFRFNVMGMSFVCLVGPEANQFILKDFPEYFSSYKGWSFIEPLFDKSILLQDGPEHQRTRKMMMPSFHSSSINEYCRLIHEITQTSLDKLTNQERTISLNDFFHDLTSEISWKLLLGSRANNRIQYFQNIFNQFTKGVQTVLRVKSTITRFGKAISAKKQLRELLQEEIDYRRTFFTDDILGLLLRSADQDGNTLSDDEVITNCLQLIFGGFDTLPLLLCWSLYELNANPAYLQMIRDQLDSFGEIRLDSFRQADKLDFFLKEMERLYPPAYVVPRGVLTAFDYLGYRIPERYYVVYSPLLTHRIPDLFEDPNRFDPLRFSIPREEHKIHPFGLIGFGGGAHKCLGIELASLEMRVILATLIKKFDWKVYPDLSFLESRNRASINNRNLAASFEVR